MKDFGPIVPLVTPCSCAGVPDLIGLQAVCQEMLQVGCKGIFVAGSTGRGPLVQPHRPGKDLPGGRRPDQRGGPAHCRRFRLGAARHG